MSKINLDYLDVFVITNGRESYKYVIDSLTVQRDVNFKINIIKNEEWLNACNICLNHSNKKYYLRLDDDMILHPFALKYLDYMIENDKTKNAIMYYSRLWEPWNNRLCGSVKIYNRELSKTIGFKIDSRGKVDKIFKKKALEKGYKYVSDKTSAIAIHAACSFNDNYKYSQMRNEIDDPSFKIRNKEIIKLDRVYNKIPLSKQLEMANKDLYELNKKNNSDFYKFIGENYEL